MSCRAGSGSVALLLCAASAGGQSFVNWESPHVHPLDVTPNGEALVAVNTADNRIEVYRIDGPDDLTHLGAVPVGLDPVSVRARTLREIWVANRVSDSVSIVDLDTMSVTATINVPDEPGDIVFADGRAFISVGTFNEVHVYDVPYDPGSTPLVVVIDGEDPQAMAVRGGEVLVAIRNAGNRTSVVNHALVTNAGNNPYEGDPNPPPNLGAEFDPPVNPDLLADNDGDGLPDFPPPRSSLIVKLDDTGTWRDVNGADWSEAAFWTVHGHALAHIDAATLAVSYTNDLMTLNSAIDVSVAGTIAVVGAHSLNHVRFEPNLRGRFMTMGAAIVGPNGAVSFHDLNPHLAGFFPAPQGIDGFTGLPGIVPLPIGQKLEAVGDPRGVAWSPEGTYRLVTGRGSNSLVKVGGGGARLGHIPVGQGPTGVRFHTSLERAYVLNHFDGSISLIDTASLEETGRVSFHDPTPAAIRSGRPHFYDTHKSSAFGHLSCQSCHTDGAQDSLAWDLGDPAGAMKEFNQVCINDSPVCDATDWHPMKGPMTTQTLFGIIGTEPFHWRGDREDLAAFNPAFDSLLAGDLLTDEEMAEFEAFVATLTFPPNPFRSIDGSLMDQHPNGGNPQTGEVLFTDGGAGAEFGEPIFGHVMIQDGGAAGGGVGFNCAACHTLPTGTNSQILRTFIADTVTGIHHLTKTAQLRNMYRKTGFDVFGGEPLTRGTGFLHDGSFDTLRNFLTFFFAMEEQDLLDVEGFLLSLATDTHAGVGHQVTLGGTDGDDTPLRDVMIAVADTSGAALTVKGLVGGEPRGYVHLGGDGFQSDRASEMVTTADLDAALAAGGSLTYTLVPGGTGTRIGVDRDEDGVFDRDEIDACSDPADPAVLPGDVEPECCAAVCVVEPLCCEIGWGAACADLAAAVCVPPCPADLTGDTVVDVQDLVAVVLAWGDCDADPCPADLTGDLVVDVSDLVIVILSWGVCP